jgi:hypothetical protein
MPESCARNLAKALREVFPGFQFRVVKNSQSQEVIDDGAAIKI